MNLRTWDRSEKDLGAVDRSPGRVVTLGGPLKVVIQRCGVIPTRYLLVVSVSEQKMTLYEKGARVSQGTNFPSYLLSRRYVVSTSRHGVGQEMHSRRTPLGLHRVESKVGGGHPIGTIFRERRPVGLTWDGGGRGAIVHRLLWLEGLEHEVNRGGNVDSHRRFIYIHGCADESRLGRPASSGCVHLAASDLIPLYDKLPVGTLVWIAERA